MAIEKKAETSRYSNGPVLLRFRRNDRSVPWRVVVKSERVHGTALYGKDL